MQMRIILGFLVNAVPPFLPIKVLTCVLTLWFLPLSTLWPTNSLEPIAPVNNPCPRFPAGSVVHNTPALFSQNGYLSVRFLIRRGPTPTAGPFSAS
jgi:hypothetical protein